MSTIEFRGQTFQVGIDRDRDAAPTDFECYDAEQIARWERNEWYFVVVNVWTLDEEDKGAEQLIGSLGAVEWDLTDSNEYALRTVPLELLAEWAAGLNAKEEPVERGELSWSPDAVRRLVELAKKRPMADLELLVNTVQQLSDPGQGDDEIEAYFVEDAYIGLWG